MSDTLTDDLRAWIGRSSDRQDTITPRLIAQFSATLTPHLAPDTAVPPGIFWTLCPDVEQPAMLGRDGHPRTGITLPALPYPRRMWAGGELSFHGDFRPDDLVTRKSTIENIALKTGSTGKLGFVTVRHHYLVAGRLVLDERQDIVYREDPAPDAAPPVPPPAPDLPVVTSREVAVDPVMMFRYSALTFNGHRIHYDHPYATGVEGYAGLVIHGPLQATLMLNLATELIGGLPRSFTYRGLAPVTCGPPISVQAGARTEGELALRVLAQGNHVTMQARARG